MASLLRVLLLQIAVANAAGDFYAVLGVPRDASKKDISVAFRKLSLRWHPDKNMDAREEAERRMRELSEAYTVLSNADERRLYDARAQQGHLRQQGGQWQPQQTRETSQGQTHYYTYDSYGGAGVRTQAKPQSRRERPQGAEYYYLREESGAGTQAEPQPAPRASSSTSGEDFYYVNFD